MNSWPKFIASIAALIASRAFLWIASSIGSMSRAISPNGLKIQFNDLTIPPYRWIVTSRAEAAAEVVSFPIDTNTGARAISCNQPMQSTRQSYLPPKPLNKEFLFLLLSRRRAEAGRWRRNSTRALPYKRAQKFCGIKKGVLVPTKADRNISLLSYGSKVPLALTRPRFWGLLSSLKCFGGANIRTI